MNLPDISASQLSRKLRDIPSSLMERIFKAIILNIQAKKGWHFVNDSLRNLNIIDASTVVKCLVHMHWAKFRDSKAGIKIHLSLRLHSTGSYPQACKITEALKSDKSQLS